MEIFLLFLATFAVTAAQHITQLQVPLYADPRRAAELSCHFDMDVRRLHSVKWYRNLHEIFRYNPSQRTQIRLFNVTGVVVQNGSCGEDWCSVRLLPPPRHETASYTCEVSSEGPMFNIAKETKHMTVVAMPEKDPVIENVPYSVRRGEQVELNCVTDYSLPAAEISWFVDGDLMKFSPWDRFSVSEPVAGGLRYSWRKLKIASSVAPKTLHFRCEARLPVEPPMIRSATAQYEVTEAVQLSKYVFNNNGSSLPKPTIITALFVVLWSLQLLRTKL